VSNGPDEITEQELRSVELHLSRLAALDDPPNAAMLERLRRGARDAEDVAFFHHETHEASLVAAGEDARAAHLATLAWQRIAYEPGYERFLYHPSVVDAFREYFNPAAYRDR
jgi:hypothetical protein